MSVGDVAIEPVHRYAVVLRHDGLGGAGHPGGGGMRSILFQFKEAGKPYAAELVLKGYVTGITERLLLTREDLSELSLEAALAWSAARTKK